MLDEHGAIVMAHPFSAVPLGFSVMGATTLWWGGCAWDSFALPNLVADADPALVATRCRRAAPRTPGTSRARGLPPGDQVAHFLVRLEAGYVRREPSAAAAYLRSVGLTGPFWGT
ncbi:organomercurial lyase [Actinomadura darangshiensis]|uniref:organomercurial lyase n=1 Tax=Actinomadura darangshiensis TaxID=705336 RepID=UPI001A9E9ABD|nr:organomercurial lyase [Actinomadura darangshiensis]